MPAASTLTPIARRLFVTVPAAPGWQRTPTTWCASNPVSSEISPSACSMIRYLSRKKSPTTRTVRAGKRERRVVRRSVFMGAS